jgi:hypothetical protein
METNKRVTAVQWLIENSHIIPKNELNKRELIKQAKEMEKQQLGYSEEEAGELVYNILGEYARECNIIIDVKKLNVLFEKFKKK